MSKLSIIIPCFNEERTIDKIIPRVESAYLPPGWQKEIIIVDDFSTDGTRGKMSEYSTKHTVILRGKNEGKGAAVKSGLEKATGDFILIQDADLEYDPGDYQRLITALDKKHRIVFGSRLRQKNDYFNLAYLYGSRFLTEVFNLFFGSKITDMTTCYKLFPREVIPSLMTYSENDFVFDAVYLTYELNKFSGNIIEVPISYRPRSRSEGKKVNWRHGLESLLAMIKIRVGKFWQFFKFFVTGGVSFFVSICALYFFTDIMQVYYLTSSVAAFLLAVTVNFVLQKLWTFGETKGNIYMEVPSFLVLQVVVNLFLNITMLYLFVEYLHIWYLLSQAIISLGLAVVTFFVSKNYIFKSRFVVGVN